MSTTLYRKYRPGRFSEVVSQEHVKTTLQNEITSNRLAHAFLFSGPRGVGKTTLARILAKSLNCLQPDKAEPCGQCENCLAITLGNFLDLVEIDAASNRGINEIRELREQTKYSPARGKYKVFIIDEVHMLTTEAFNALLKTLEEPPAHAIFVLATTEIHKIPETIISRCQRFDFKKVAFAEVVNHLQFLADQEEIKVDKKVLEKIARISEGYLRDAISLLGQILTLGEKEISEDEASLVLPRSDWQSILELNLLVFQTKIKEAVLLVNKLADEGADLENFILFNIEFLRKLLFAKITADWQILEWDLGQENLAELKNILAKISDKQLVDVLEIFIQASINVKRTKIIQLPLEMAVVESGLIFTAEKNDHDQSLPPASPPPAISADNENKNTAVTALPDKSEPASSSVSQIEDNGSEIPTVITLAEVLAKWPEVIETLKEYNHSLATFLKVGRPEQVSGRRITVAFQFNFHYERIAEKKNMEIVQKVLEKIYNCPLTIEGNITNEKKAFDFVKKDTKAIDDILNVFGGEVVG